MTYRQCTGTATCRARAPANTLLTTPCHTRHAASARWVARRLAAAQLPTPPQHVAPRLRPTIDSTLIGTSIKTATQHHAHARSAPLCAHHQYYFLSASAPAPTGAAAAILPPFPTRLTYLGSPSYRHHGLPGHIAHPRICNPTAHTGPPLPGPAPTQLPWPNQPVVPAPIRHCNIHQSKSKAEPKAEPLLS